MPVILMAVFNAADLVGKVCIALGIRLCI
jgi:hypothetical protein